MLRLNIASAVTSLTLLGLVHHLRKLHEADAAPVYMDRPLVYRYQRPVGDDPVNLGHPLHDADAYLRGLSVTADGLMVEFGISDRVLYGAARLSCHELERVQIGVL